MLVLSLKEVVLINVFIGFDEDQSKVRFGFGAFTGTTSGNLTFTSDVPVLFGNIETSRLTTNEVIERVNVDSGF